MKRRVRDNLSSGHRDAVLYGTLVEGEPGDSARLGKVLATGFDAVMHFASYIQVGEWVRQPGKYYRNNVEFAQFDRGDGRTRHLQLHFQFHGSGVRRTAISPHRRSAPEVAQRVTGRPIRAVDGARRAGDSARLAADATRARTELNWKPRYADLESIIDHAWNWETRLSRRPQIAGAQLSR